MDPRVTRTRAAVIRAATDLLVEGGPNAVTVDAIVARSGVAKSTIYRHWESRDEILLAVLDHCAPTFPPPDPALGVEGGLRAVLHALADTLVDPEWAQMVPALLMLKHHEAGVAAIDERLHHEQEDVLNAILQRGIDEGVLPADLDIPEALTTLVGPLLFAQLTGVMKIDEGFPDRIVDRFLAAHQPGDR